MVVEHASNHRVCLKQAVYDIQENCRQIFPRHHVLGLSMPHDGGDPLTYLRSWAALTEVAAYRLGDLAQQMALDLNPTGSVDEETDATATAEERRECARSIAEHLLYQIQPDATLKRQFMNDFLGRQQLNAFVEVMQIQHGMEELSQKLVLHVQRCQYPSD